VTAKVFYQFGTIFRQVAKRDLKVCQLFRKGVFYPADAVSKIFYAAVGHAIPENIKQGCPFKKGVFNLTNITVALTELPFNQLIPSGVYKLVLNITTDGIFLAHGSGAAEIKTPLSFWS
jgi:hypothetical protein